MPVVLVGVRVPVQLPPDAAGRMSTPAADGGAGRSVSSGREGDVGPGRNFVDGHALQDGRRGLDRDEADAGRGVVVVSGVIHRMGA